MIIEIQLEVEVGEDELLHIFVEVEKTTGHQGIEDEPPFSQYEMMSYYINTEDNGLLKRSGLSFDNIEKLAMDKIAEGIADVPQI